MPRQDAIPKWLKLIGEEMKQKQNEFEKYPENFRLDHPDQSTIRQDCQSLESRSPIFQESDLKNALELLLTYYCKTESIPYKSGLHEVLAPFFIMRFSNLKTVYGAFCAFISKMIPSMFTVESNIDYAYNIFQKLMMYHEPILFNTLQSSFPSHVGIVKKWILTAMAACLDPTGLLKFWEYCLEESNFSLPIFACVSLLYRQREKLMKKNKGKAAVIEENEVDDVSELIKEAVMYQTNTPKSFQKMMEKVVLANKPSKSYMKELDTEPILKTSQKELKKPQSNCIVIDMRNYSLYIKGHFPQSFCISSDLSITTGK